MIYLKLFDCFRIGEIDKLRSLNKSCIFSTKTNSIIKGTDLYYKLRSYDVSRFYFDTSKSYGIFIYPDREFLSLIGYRDNFFIYLTISGDEHVIDFDNGLPDKLKGSGTGYKIYRSLFNYYDYISTTNLSTSSAKNIWYYLMIDRDLYCFTSMTKSGSILKSCSDEKLLNFYNMFSNVENVVFDTEFRWKIRKIKNNL